LELQIIQVNAAGKEKEGFMKKLIQSEGSRELIVVALTVACFGLLPHAYAVVPAPDGCYPGFTTAEGCNALQFLGAGTGNTGVGWYSLFSVGDANFNTGVGAGTLVLNTGDSNTAVGVAALLLNTVGHNNTAVGTNALVYNDGGSFNNAVGAFALSNNIDGLSNNAFGDSALFENIHANNNTAIGDFALSNNDDTGTGLGSSNTAVGALALFSNTDGAFNTAIGTFALQNNTNGGSNTAIGILALQNNTSGGANTAIGTLALQNNTSGGANIAIGAQAGSALTTESANIDIGNSGVAGDDTTIRIGSAFLNFKTFIAGIDGVIVGGLPVVVNGFGQLGIQASSARFKEKIKPMNDTSEALLSLKPVTFRYKEEIDPAGKLQFGLVAEEVEKVSPDLVVRDKEGKPCSVRYDQVNAMLLNEFLKEHRKVQQLEGAVAKQQINFQSKLAEQHKQIETLAAGLQRFSAQLEASKRAPQMASTNP
jgi:trimeric autotransporter adhesin